ncbi:hypothetical protein SAY86_028474 [Trapa natans]|uniref:Uncharacterized protein n=1 Tax=Trapa natans TaxID=22666 RepID=A0AAN7MII2_TRANT|nr:hypothetical protein SAY86_028474 [Trapa natans]
MGGNSRFHKKAASSASSSSSSSSKHSAFSLLSFLKLRRRPTSGRDDTCAHDDASSPGKVWRHSDYDKGRYVAQPGIDEIATIFIARFHENRVLE